MVKWREEKEEEEDEEEHEKEEEKEEDERRCRIRRNKNWKRRHYLWNLERRWKWEPVPYITEQWMHFQLEEGGGLRERIQ